ncbi:hypothetical protein SUGI_0707410 [Cryptomeria japonica]|uniref:F-box/kelch-repeat protein At1g80440-like n=1 Tax=Cryptomeria japonica TaxID=3369 RepID=UPI0024147783|nr:F-box/kelch-repeat protein At1g80440-like [Cryptomeria japonica]GLJ35143.1 hypothetical protein SUGI_0707410 [Cryptomeria japonica]
MNIIPGLPKDLGLQCLVKVPYKLHKHLRAVCKSWNAVLSSPNFYKERQHHNECEEGIAYFHIGDRPTDWEVIIYYPNGRWWERLPRTTEDFILDWQVCFKECNCVYVRSKQVLVAMGLLNKYDERATVLMFNFLSRTWRRGLNMPFRLWNRGRALSPSPQGLIYIAGCMRDGTNPHVVQFYVYNVEQNGWDFLPPINPDWVQNFCVAEFVDDMFYLLPSHARTAHIYDPHSRLWRTINIDSNGQGVDRIVSAFGNLYGFSCIESFGTDFVIVKQFDFANSSFIRVGQYPAQIYDVECAVLCGDYIFVIPMDFEDVYYQFNPSEIEEGKRWTEIEMPAEFPTENSVSATAVQI